MLLFVDTETNGLPRNWKAPVSDLNNWPRMVQIAWFLYDEKGELRSESDDIIFPEGFRVDPAGTKIHGISHARALEEGIPLGEAMGKFREALSQSGTWVAHNANFDQMILGAEFLRLRQSNPMPQHPVICTMKDTVDFCQIPGKYGFKWPTLAELHLKLFGENFEEAHNARADIAATARCFWELRRRKVL